MSYTLVNRNTGYVVMSRIPTEADAEAMRQLFVMPDPFTLSVVAAEDEPKVQRITLAPDDWAVVVAFVSHTISHLDPSDARNLPAAEAIDRFMDAVLVSMP